MMDTHIVTFIEGNRVSLIPINFNHLDLYIKWENNPKVRRYSRNSLPFTKEVYKKHLESLQKKIPEDIPFEIFLKKDEMPIGICELSEIDWINQVSNVGILIGEIDYWGNDYCTEVIRLLIKYAFEELNLQKLKYVAFSPNKASLRCAEKAGFTHEATLMNEMYIDGIYYNSIFYTLFKKDWIKTR
jgi:RimJ/RimL family protein N-acetyltransferase